MKQRTGFVSNSSSSSFIVMYAGDDEILEAGDGRDEYESDYATIDIDELIDRLNLAKTNGVTEVSFEFGGGYNG